MFTIYRIRFVVNTHIMELTIYRKEVVPMTIKEAVEKRIVELCNERGIAINNLANISGVSPSTI